jgi:hypothetical protein
LKEKLHMFRNMVRRVDRRGFAAIALLLGSTLALADEGADKALTGWLDKEIEIYNSTVKDQVPVGGKFTLVYDSSKDVVRFCPKQDGAQQKQWSGDLATACGVTMTFTRGTRYCTDAEVKTGDAETLASCHRLRSREVAMSKASDKGVELNDLIIFLVQGDQGKKNITFLVDSPSRTTASGSGGGGVGSGNDGGQGGG